MPLLPVVIVIRTFSEPYRLEEAMALTTPKKDMIISENVPRFYAYIVQKALLLMDGDTIHLLSFYLHTILVLNAGIIVSTKLFKTSKMLTKIE